MNIFEFLNKFARNSRQANSSPSQQEEHLLSLERHDSSSFSSIDEVGYEPSVNKERTPADPAITLNDTPKAFASLPNYQMDPRRDEKQRETICLDEGYHLVLAPAGCGKTDILAERVYRALCNGVKVEDMLCLTFTNRASRGMRSRIKKVVGDRAKELFIGNTHRFCSKFVFENNIISQSSSILDEDDVLSVINSLSSFIMEDKDDIADTASLEYEIHKRLTAVLQVQHLMMQYRLGHPKSVVLSKESDYADPDRTIRFFSPQRFAILCKEAGVPVSIASLLNIYDNSSSYLNSPEIIYSSDLIELLHAAKEYESYKHSENVIDFDDLLILTYEYARHNPDLIQKYKWIQIDEVQDLNPLQFAIVDAFTAEENVTIYLGDEQQAIFSFIGAKLNTLSWLKERCGKNLHHLNKCYRSPKYLLDLFNDYANLELDTDPDYLPTPNNFDAPKYDDLTLRYTYSNRTAPYSVVEILSDNAEGRTAIIVNSNAYANDVSKALDEHGIPHFKISGTDLFYLRQIKLLFAHLNVVNFEINFLAWARIFSSLKIIPKYADARQFVSSMKFNGINPSDFILFPHSSYLLEFLKYYRHNPVVIFDTETTGLDVYSNDIVQIAANKYIDGEKVGSLNILLHTDQELPAMLGKIVNPLVEEYANNPHVERSSGLKQFVDFAKGCVLIGHNVQYDYNILLNNCKRDLPNTNIPELFPIIFDTLKLTRLVCPNFRSYKLKDLLSALNLEGENSHLADDDIVATYSLAEYCFNQANDMKDTIMQYLTNNSAIAELLREKYGEIYLQAKSSLYSRTHNDTCAIVRELKKVYNFYVSSKTISPVSKFQYICDFLEKNVIDVENEPSLYEQLSNHIMDLNTYKEADLCDDEKNSVIKEKVFIATVHKAKGLEFENVIVYGTINDIYPFFANRNDPEARKEDARKLYVAISRAKKRLCLLAFDNKEGISRYGNYYCFPATISPFLHNVLNRHKFHTINY